MMSLGGFPGTILLQFLNEGIIPIPLISSLKIGSDRRTAGVGKIFGEIIFVHGSIRSFVALSAFDLLDGTVANTEYAGQFFTG